MERLTTRIDGYAYGKSGIKRLSRDYHRGSFECTALIERLAEYEDLDEKGLLLRLPCKVGDTVFMILSQYSECTPHRIPYTKSECENCRFLGDEDYCDSYKEYYVAEVCVYNLYDIIGYMSTFGKTVFLSRKEAERKLKELQKEGYKQWED